MPDFDASLTDQDRYTGFPPDDDVSEAVTNAAIAVIETYPDVATACRSMAAGASAVPQDTDEATDKITGNAIRYHYGVKIAGDLSRFVNWTVVGAYFREAGEGVNENLLPGFTALIDKLDE